MDVTVIAPRYSDVRLGEVAVPIFCYVAFQLELFHVCQGSIWEHMGVHMEQERLTCVCSFHTY